MVFGLQGTRSSGFLLLIIAVGLAIAPAEAFPWWIQDLIGSTADDFDNYDGDAVGSQEGGGGGGVPSKLEAVENDGGGGECSRDDGCPASTWSLIQRRTERSPSSSTYTPEEDKDDYEYEDESGALITGSNKQGDLALEEIMGSQPDTTQRVGQRGDPPEYSSSESSSVSEDGSSPTESLLEQMTMTQEEAGTADAGSSTSSTNQKIGMAPERPDGVIAVDEETEVFEDGDDDHDDYGDEDDDEEEED